MGPQPVGLGSPLARGVGAGFRPSRGVLAPSAPYEIHQHEVTWDELDGWLVETPAQMFPGPSFAVAAPAAGAAVKGPVPLPKEGAAYRDALCVTGPCVDRARDACKLVGFRCTRPAVQKRR